MKRYYLAYGSNLNIEQMGYRCPDAKRVGTTEIPDYRLAFKGSRTGSYLTIEECKGASVPVGIWEVSAGDERNLDRYEGYPTFYSKHNVQLRLGKGRKEKSVGFIYIMNSIHGYGIPSETYMEICREGYNDFGFEPHFLEDAYKLSAERSGR